MSQMAKVINPINQNLESGTQVIGRGYQVWCQSKRCVHFFTSSVDSPSFSLYSLSTLHFRACLQTLLTLSFAVIVAVFFLILGSNNINNNGNTAKMKDYFERDDAPMLVDAVQPPGSLTQGTHSAI